MSAASYIIDSEETVIGMGGFSGTDDAPSVDQLAQWTATGELRFVLSSSGGGFPGGGFAGGSGEDHNQVRHEWIEQHCAEVAPSSYGGSSEPSQPTTNLGGASTLYECGA